MACDLRIPWPLWAADGDPKKEEENYRTLERWADNLLKNCLPSGGRPEIYCLREEETIALTSGTGGMTSGGLSFTLSERSTVAIACSWSVSSDVGFFGVTANVGISGEYTEDVESAAATGDAVTYRTSVSVNSAGTFDAGTYSALPTLLTIDNAWTGFATVKTNMTLIIGANTEDHCLLPFSG